MTILTPVRVLLVEDNPLDIKATLKAAERLEITGTIEVVHTGDEALDHLRRDSGSNLRPELVLLDLNLPGRDGRDVLAEMKADELLRRIPVIVLTTSEDEADVLSAYELGANAYVSKPIGLDGWTDVVSKIAGFWLTLAKVPRT